MPNIPTVQLDDRASRRQLPELGTPGAAYVARGLDDLAHDFQRISEGADIAERTKLIGEAGAGFEMLIQKHGLETTDPEEYKTVLTDGIASLYNDT